MSKSQIDDIKNSILRYLSMREHSRLELINKLSKKNFEMGMIVQCLDQFLQKKLQSDERYTESFVRSKYNDHKGPSFISASLKSKGVKVEIIDRYLSKFEDEDWNKTAIEALHKKSVSKNISKDKSKEKQKNFLMQRGFRFKTIENAINEYWKQWI